MAERVLSTPPVPSPARVTVCALTFRRPQLLPALVEALDRARREVDPAEAMVEVLIIDNDPQGSGAAVLSALRPQHVRWVVEATPGISAARNRALTEADSSDALVFIDDDETPTAQWLVRLLGTWREHRATAVAARVLPEYAVTPDPWILAGRFFDRRSLRTGSVVSVAATNNLLLDLRAVRRLGLRFDGQFGLTGGEDGLFTSALTRAGGRIVWCDEAAVTDLVPAARLRRRWVLMRAVSHGNSSSLIDLQLVGSSQLVQARMRFAVGGVARMGGGGVRALLGVLGRSPRHQARGLRTACRGVGMLAGVLGWRFREYARDGDSQWVRVGTRSTAASALTEVS
ncbi:MAG: glycosyltransferase [Actinomycetales bacterium]|nr:glycosyltransferase [Actinomycetales bacterium]